MNRKSKLYHLTHQEFRLPFHVDKNHSVITVAANDVPMVFWPDGRWCLPANVFMLELFSRGLSRKNRGGTLFTYVSQISHLLRFCYANSLELQKISDSHFTLFIKTLGSEKSAACSEPIRTATSVLAIGRVCLDFLASIARFYQLEKFIGPDGRIRAEMKEYEVRGARRARGKLKVIRKYWHHHSFPQPSPKNTRLPISTENIEKLNEAVYSLDGGTYLRKRRFIMIKLLEITGARRSEVAALTVKSVIDAAKMPHPMLKLITAKRPGGAEDFRYIPISRQDVKLLTEFIEVNRRRIIRSTCGFKGDNGCLLVSQTTGMGLMPNTITQELRELSIAAGIQQQTCAHMFRHRFITKLFVALIEQHHSDNPNDFRKLLMDSEAIKQKIRQWTGHRELQSLENYMHLAIEEFSGFKASEKIVFKDQMLTSLRANIKHLKNELAEGVSPIEIAATLTSIFAAAEKDVGA